ncbi:DUF1853 family protein [Verrucomicrobia bacterium]|nr:DUF1853 family protein [Verrucomicrobiota bacterium]
MIPPSQAVRDLKWTIGSPSLIEQDPLVSELFQIERVDDADAMSVQLDRFLLDQNPRRHAPRVGHYFETLVHFWLQQVCGYEIVEQGRQIVVDGVTRGELDFVFRDKQERLHHVETAVKFYLHIEKENHTGSHFVGPNAGDHFEKKMNRLFDKQLKLSEGLYEEPHQVWPWVKGRIFYHPQSTKPAQLPERLSGDSLRGIWIHAFELGDFVDQGEYERYQILRKPHWLAALPVEAGEAGEAGEEGDLTPEALQTQLHEHFLNDPTPRLIICRKKAEKAQGEAQHLFVVNDRWPD